MKLGELREKEPWEAGGPLARGPGTLLRPPPAAPAPPAPPTGHRLTPLTSQPATCLPPRLAQGAAQRMFPEQINGQPGARLWMHFHPPHVLRD